MVLWLLSSFALSEAVVGVILTVLLVMGRATPTYVVDVVSFVGFLILAAGLLPLLHKVRGLTLGAPAAEKTNEGDEAEAEEVSRSKAHRFAKKHANLLQTILVGGIVFVTGLGLLYLTGPF